MGKEDDDGDGDDGDDDDDDNDDDGDDDDDDDVKHVITRGFLYNCMVWISLLFTKLIRKIYL